MPLFDSYNNLIAITSRDFEAPPQYQHWHESFEKGSYLYGLNWAKKYIQNQDKAILVEGQFDTACFHSFGFKITVGILGTAFSILQLCLLARYCSEIYLILDGDHAGRESLIRSIDLYHRYSLTTSDIKIYPVILPDDVDPDDYLVDYGKIALLDIMKKSKEFVVKNGLKAVSELLKK